MAIPNRRAGLRDVAVALLLLALAAGCGDDGADPAFTPIAHVAYIYWNDPTAGRAARDLLGDHGIAVRLIAYGDAVAHDFADDDLIVIDRDIPFPYWPDLDTVAAVQEAGRPVLGMGKGGYALFGHLGLDIGFPHAAHARGTQARLAPACSCLVSTPNHVAVPADSLLVVSLRDSEYPMIYQPPATVTRYAHWPADTRYSIIVEQQRYLLWGFDAPADALTAAGAGLFVNTVRHMLDR